jgi:hypothetical protein
MMKDYILGVDIDGVITNEDHPNDNIWHNALCEFLGRNISRVKDAYYFNEAYDLTDEEVNLFLEEKLESIYSQVKVIPEAQKTLRELAQMGFEIILITARDTNFIELTENWLVKNGIPFSELIHDDNKTPVALARNIQLFIEDNAQNASELTRAGIHVILLNKYHNRHLPANERLVRVDSWEEIRKAISDFFHINLE